MTDCEHRVIMTWTEGEDGGGRVAMWTCVGCRRGFVPKTEAVAAGGGRVQHMKEVWQAEAVAAERARIAKAVIGVADRCHWDAVEVEVAVLRIIEGEIP